MATGGRSGRWAVILASVLVVVVAAAAASWRLASGLLDATPAGGDSGANAAPNPFLPTGEIDRSWPFIRGPDFDGHSPEIRLAESWPAGGPPVVWRRELGEGYSSLVAGGGRVYTQYQSPAGQFVVCLNAASGETIWEHRYDWPFEPGGMYPGPRATPTLAGGRIYFAGTNGLIGCLSDRGRLIWSVNVNESFQGRGTDFGYACSPTVIDGRVILPVGGPGAALVALSAADGSLMWQAGDVSASYTPALPITVDGQRQVVGYLENAIIACDLQTGEVLWSYPLSQGYDEHAAWPIYVDGHLWISGPFQAGCQLLRVTGGPGAAVELVRRSDAMSNDVASSVHVDGHVYGFNLKETQTKPRQPSRGEFRCIDFRTGEVRWTNGDAKARRRWPATETSTTTDGEVQVIGHANFIVADEKLILLNDVGELILARASPQRYEELGRTSILPGEICWTTPALDRGCVYVRNHAHVACVYIGEPELFDERLRAVATQPTSASAARSPVGLAAMIGIQPGDTFQIRTLGSLWKWYVYSLAVIFTAAVFTAAIAAAKPLFFQTDSRWQYNRRLFWSLTFALGIVAVAVLTHWRGEFIFTWPVALFVMLPATIDQLPLRPPALSTRRQEWSAATVVALFMILCGIYLLVCRQLGLAAEWIFLTGFAAAVPLVVVGKWLANQAGYRPWWEPPLTAAGFTLYYWACVGLLFWRY